MVAVALPVFAVEGEMLTLPLAEKVAPELLVGLDDAARVAESVVDIVDVFDREGDALKEGDTVESTLEEGLGVPLQMQVPSLGDPHDRKQLRAAHEVVEGDTETEGDCVGAVAEDDGVVHTQEMAG